jgi:hypothetical protein
MEHEPDRYILLESKRDCEVVCEAAKLGGLGRRAAYLQERYGSLADSELPVKATDCISNLSFYVVPGLTKIAANLVRSQVVEPEEAEACLQEVFGTSYVEQMAPALPYASE